MVERKDEQLHKKDLEIILEVNKKAIEIETEVAEQNEEIISLLTEHKKKLEEVNDITSQISEKAESISKDLFKIQVLFITGLLSLVIQVIQMILRK